MINILTSIEFSSAILGALLGAVVGGFFTWLATWYTMRNQRKLDEEQRRIDYMPLLRFTAFCSQGAERKNKENKRQINIP